MQGHASDMVLPCHVRQLLSRNNYICSNSCWTQSSHPCHTYWQKSSQNNSIVNGSMAFAAEIDEQIISPRTKSGFQNC